MFHIIKIDTLKNSFCPCHSTTKYGIIAGCNLPNIKNIFTLQNKPLELWQVQKNIHANVLK